MKNKKIWLGMLVIILTFGMVFVGCKDGGGGNTHTTHTWDQWSTTIYPTQTQSGLQTRTCIYCGVTDSQTIPPTGGGGGGTTVPSAPTGVSATAQSSSSIRVTWNSVSGATSYDVYYEIGSSSTKNFAGNTTSTSYTHTGLTANTTYYYYIKAKNSAGESGYSSYGSATTSSSGGGGSVPSAPSGVAATAQSSSSIRVTWNSVSGATSYKLYYGSPGATNPLLSRTVTATSYDDTFLVSNSTYYYKVSAINSAGEGPASSIVSATTSSSGGGGGTVPSAPSGVAATAQSSSSIQVTWNSVSGATSYDVYYEIGNSTTKNFAGNTTSTSYTHTGLTANTTYWYYIKAKNSAGESGYSSYAYTTTSSSSGGGGGVGTIRVQNDSYSSPIKLTTIVENPSTVFITSSNEIAVGSYRDFSASGGKQYRVNVLISTSTSYNSNWFTVTANQTVTVRFTGTGFTIQ